MFLEPRVDVHKFQLLFRVYSQVPVSGEGATAIPNQSVRHENPQIMRGECSEKDFGKVLRSCKFKIKIHLDYCNGDTEFKITSKLKCIEKEMKMIYGRKLMET